VFSYESPLVSLSGAEPDSVVTPTPIESTANWAVSFKPPYMMVVFAGLQWVRPPATMSFGH